MEADFQPQNEMFPFIYNYILYMWDPLVLFRNIFHSISIVCFNAQLAGCTAAMVWMNGQAKTVFKSIMIQTILNKHELCQTEGMTDIAL